MSDPNGCLQIGISSRSPRRRRWLRPLLGARIRHCFVTGSTATPPLLEVDGLAKAFDHTGGPMGRRTGQVRAVDGVSFTIAEGTTFALVGESGCGKTTTARMLLLLERPTAGKILFYGQDVTGLRGRGLRTHKRSVQAVFQDPYASLSRRLPAR